MTFLHLLWHTEFYLLNRTETIAAQFLKSQKIEPGDLTKSNDQGYWRQRLDLKGPELMILHYQQLKIGRFELLTGQSLCYDFPYKLIEKDIKD